MSWNYRVVLEGSAVSPLTFTLIHMHHLRYTSMLSFSMRTLSQHAFCFRSGNKDTAVVTVFPPPVEPRASHSCSTLLHLDYYIIYHETKKNASSGIFVF